MKPSVLAKIEKYAIWATLFLVPLVILPVFPNPFVTGKIAILLFGVLITLVVKMLRMYIEGHLRLSGGIFDISVIILVAGYIFSTLTQTPNKMEAILFPGSTTLIVFSALLYMLINQLDDEDKRKTRYFLILPAVVLSIVSFLSVAGILNSFTSLPAYIRSASFNLVGGSLPSFIYLLAILPMAGMLAIKTKDAASKVFLGIATILILMGTITSGLDAYSTSRNSALLPSLRSSWFVAVDSLKESPLAGIGPGNYLTAYNRFRPLTDNTTDNWQARFTTGRNFFFTTITETGLVGIAGIIFLLLTLYALLKRDSNSGKIISADMLINDNFISLLVLLVLLTLFPSFPAITVLLFALLALGAKSHRLHLGFMPKEMESDAETTEEEVKERPSRASRAPFVIIALPVLAFVVLAGFNAFRFLVAEAQYKTALDAVVKNDGRAAYDQLRTAINANPFVDRYHVTYAQINLLLANSVAGKQDLSDQDKQTVSTLIEQAIREGKNAVALNTTRAGNWEVLASIYRTIIPLAKGADAFAVQTYSQAIALDPGNVNSRIALGGIFYGAKNYTAAIDAFKLAVIAKQNHANARYNLAIAYKDNGQTDLAIGQLEQVLTIVERDSEDYQVAQKELNDLKTKQASEGDGEESGDDTAESGGSLTPPQSSTPAPNAQISLEEESNPPQPVVTPSPTPVPDTP